MKQIIIQMLMIAAPLVFLIDFGGFVEKIKRWFYYRKYTKDSPYVAPDWKPLDCSACLTVWLYWIVFGIALYTNSPQTIEYIYLFIEGFGAGLIALTLRRYILF